MAIFDEVSKHAAYISLKLGRLKKDSVEYQSLKSTKDAILDLGKELAISTGTNSPIPSERLFKSRPIPTCRAIRNTDQTVPHNVNTPIEYNENVYDDLESHNDKSARFHDIVTNSNRFYAHEEGKYIAFSGVRAELSGASGHTFLTINKVDKNGTSVIIAEQAQYNANLAIGTILSVGTVVYMFPGEYLEAILYTDNSLAASITVKASTATWQPTQFCITGPIGGVKSSNATTHFRPNSNAVPRTSEGGGSGTTQTRPMCKVYHSSNQSIANATPTILSFDSEDFDIGSMHSTSSNTSRITIGVTGKYMIGATICFSPSAYTFLEARLIKNGVVDPFIDIDSDENGSGAGHSRRRLSMLVDCTAGDYFEVQVYQVTGAALNVDVHANYSPRFWAYLVSALYVE